MANVIKHKRGSGSDPGASDLVVGEVAIRTDVGKLVKLAPEPENVVAVMMPADIVIAVPTLSSVKVETPEEASTLPVKSPSNVVAVIIPVTSTLPITESSGSDATGLVVVLIPIFDVV